MGKKFGFSKTNINHFILRTDSYLLTQQRLAVHLIDFIDLPVKVSSKTKIIFIKNKRYNSEKYSTKNMH